MIQDHLADMFYSQERSKQVTADIQMKLQDAADAQQIKLQDQEYNIESLKERQEMQREQQSSMQGLRVK